MHEQDHLWITSKDGSTATYVLRTVAYVAYRDALTVTTMYDDIQKILWSYNISPPWVRDTCYASTFRDCGSYFYMWYYDSSERALSMIKWMWEMFSVLDISMFITTSFWLPFWAAAMAACMVFVLQIHIFGVIYVCGLQFQILLIIALSVTAGICIDEITHCIYHLVYAYGTVEERLHETIVGHGPSVMKGAISTIVGVSMLAGATSPFWKTFFYVIFSLCVLGSYMGVVVVPCMLSEFLQDNPHPDDLCFDDDFDDKQQVEMGNIGADGLSVVENDDSRGASSFKSKATTGLDSVVRDSSIRDSSIMDSHVD